MTTTITISLSKDVLQAMDDLIAESPAQFSSRSELLEMAGWALVARVRQVQRTQRDVEIINTRADALNAETLDALGYQV